MGKDDSEEKTIQSLRGECQARGIAFEESDTAVDLHKKIGELLKKLGSR